MNNFPRKIAIIGVGLIGGSIALGLKRHFGAKITIFGICSDAKRTRNAVRDGIIDRPLSKVSDIPNDINLIILATPVRTSPKILKTLSKTRLQNCFIIDVGSTKKFIMAKAQEILPKQIPFIGTHPMAGGEVSGFENASVNLFRNKPWIVCSDQLSINNYQLTIVKELVNILGARIFIMAAETHDQLTSWVSHTQLVLSSILINTIAEQKNWLEMAKIASTSFRDSSRGASHNPNMKADIILTNKTNVIAALGKFKAEIDKFLELLMKSDNRRILKYFKEAKKIRDHWLSIHFN